VRILISEDPRLLGLVDDIPCEVVEEADNGELAGEAALPLQPAGFPVIGGFFSVLGIETAVAGSRSVMPGRDIARRRRLVSTRVSTAGGASCCEGCTAESAPPDCNHTCSGMLA